MPSSPTPPQGPTYSTAVLSDRNINASHTRNFKFFSSHSLESEKLAKLIYLTQQILISNVMNIKKLRYLLFLSSYRVFKT